MGLRRIGAVRRRGCPERQGQELAPDLTVTYHVSGVHSLVPASGLASGCHGCAPRSFTHFALDPLSSFCCPSNKPTCCHLEGFTRFPLPSPLFTSLLYDSHHISISGVLLHIYDLHESKNSYSYGTPSA